MFRDVINRTGSYYCARAFLKLVVALTIVYASMAILLAIISESTVTRFSLRMILLGLALAPISAIWLVYLSALRVFKWEARRSVELNDEGIREMRDEKELKYLPWAAVREIELDATLGAGATLRIKGAFTEIAISNVDLVATDNIRLRNLYRAMAKMGRMRNLFERVKKAAPNAQLKLNHLARRRLKDYEWAGDDNPVSVKADLRHDR